MIRENPWTAFTEHYLVSDQDSGITIETTGWRTGDIRAGYDARKEVPVEFTSTLTYSDGSTEDLAPENHRRVR